jgi:hypothetical protein
VSRQVVSRTGVEARSGGLRRAFQAVMGSDPVACGGKTARDGRKYGVDQPFDMTDVVVAKSCRYQ